MKYLISSILLLIFIDCSYAQWKNTNAKIYGFTGPLACSENKIFVGTTSNWGGSIFLSTNNGKSWKFASYGIAQVYEGETVLQNDNISVLFSHKNNIFAGTQYGGLYLSKDDTSWTAINTGLIKKGDYNPITSIAVSGENIFVGTSYGGVFLSKNNGLSWVAVNKGLTKTRISSIAIIDTNIFVGTDGGVFSNTKNGTNWKIKNQGLTNLNVYSLTVLGKSIFAGTENGVFLSNNNGINWVPINNGLPPNTEVFSFVIIRTSVLAGTNSGVYLSQNNGASWTTVSNGLPKDIWVHSLTANETTVFAGFDEVIYYSSISDILSVQSSINNKIETIKLPPNTGFDIEANEGCFKINKITGGLVAIIEGNIKQKGYFAPFNLNNAWEPLCCPLVLDCNTKYVFKNYGNSTSFVELEKTGK
jgi:hypothetical protein